MRNLGKRRPEPGGPGQGGFPKAAPPRARTTARPPRPRAWRGSAGLWGAAHTGAGAETGSTSAPGMWMRTNRRDGCGPPWESGPRGVRATLPGWRCPWPNSLTFLEARTLPSSGGRSPEHVRGGSRGPFRRQGARRFSRRHHPARAQPLSAAAAILSWRLRGNGQTPSPDRCCCCCCCSGC